jgi:predicted ester cyclase
LFLPYHEQHKDCSEEDIFMSTEENKAIARRSMELINQKDIAGIDQLYAPTYTRHDPNSIWVVNREDYKEDVKILTTVFPDLHFTVEDLVAEGDKVVCRFSIFGTHGNPWRGLPATGKEVRVTGMCISRIVESKVIEDWFNTDIFSIGQQLGIIPPNSTRDKVPADAARDKARP